MSSTKKPVVPSKKTKSSFKSKPSGSWSLIRRSATEFWAHGWLYLGIVALVSVPSDILSTYFGAVSGTSLGAYLSLAGLFMNVAVIYAVIRIYRQSSDFGIRTAYYSGSHAVLRFLLTALCLGVMVIPIAIASEIYALGVAGSASLGEQLILGTVALIITLPSIWLLVRTVLSLISVVDHDEQKPFSAIRHSWIITKGRFWLVLGRLIALGLWMLLILILPIVLFVLLYILTRFAIWIMLIQLVTALVGLPLVTLYGFYLYEELQSEQN